MNNRVSKRSHQACENCRRKKTRCPGEKPSCSTCSRLHQTCQYNGLLERSLESGVLEDRLQQLEDKMDLMLEGSILNRQVGIPKSYSRGLHSDAGGSELSDTARDTPVPYAMPALPDPSPLSFAIPPKDLVAEGISLYFQYCHKQPLWLFDMDGPFIPESHRSEVILSMLSLALRYSNNILLDGRIDQICRQYAESACNSVMLRISQGSVDLSTLQSLCLIALAEYTANQTHLAWLHIGLVTNLARCSGLDQESHEGDLTLALEERRRVFWSIYLLNQQYAPHNMQLNMLHDIQNPKYMAPAMDPYREMGIKPPQTPQETGIFSRRGGIWVYMVQMSGLWNEVQHFVSHCASGDTTPPWSVQSGYSMIGAHLMDMETNYPTAHRYDSARFQDQPAEELHRDRPYWSSWLYLQLAYHAVHAVMNHPFLYSWRPQDSPQRAVPNTFWKTSSELALVHSTWIVHLIGMILEKNYKLSDPFLGHTVAIAATIHIYYCRAADQAVRESAQRKLETCTDFLSDLASQWPRFQEVHHKIQNLIHSALSPSPNMNRHNEPRRTLSIDTGLMWDILCHKSTNRSLASPAEGLFDPSFLKPPVHKEPGQDTVETEIFHHSVKAVDTSDGGQALPPYSSRVQDSERIPWTRNDSIDPENAHNQVPLPWVYPGAGFPGDVSFMDVMRSPFFQLQSGTL